MLNGVVGALAPLLPLQDLDGFTIAVDYHSALATIDRGDQSLPPISSDALGYGLGAAKLVTVCRNGSSKEHLVISAGVAGKWLSTDAGERQSGLHVLVMMLAEMALYAQYGSLRGVTFSPDSLTREIHQGVAAAPACYWRARESAFVSPDEGQAFADLVIDSLKYAEREIASERARIPTSGEIYAAMETALKCVTAVLNHAADWLGHRDGLTEGQSFLGDNLPERLRSRGLDRWIELFGRDLSACFSKEGALDLDVIRGLGSHVERILWSLGIYCWPEKDEARCLVTDRYFLPQNFT